MSSTLADQIEVRGGATPEELAAVLVLVAKLERGEPLTAYQRWREGRLRALRSATHPAQRPAHR